MKRAVTIKEIAEALLSPALCGGLIEATTG